MAHKAENKRCNLTNDRQESRKKVEEKVVDRVLQVAVVHMIHELREHNFDTIKERPKRQRYRQQECCHQQDDLELFIEKLEISLEFSDEQNGDHDEEEGQSSEEHLSHILEWQVHFDLVFVFGLRFEFVEAPESEETCVVDNIEQNHCDCCKVEYLLPQIEANDTESAWVGTAQTLL